MLILSPVICWRAPVTQAEFVHAVRQQAMWCRRLGSPLYGTLLERLAEDVDGGGACWRYLRRYADDPSRSLVPLRYLAMLHRMALAGEWPGLARCYPSCGGGADADGAWREIRTNSGWVRQEMPGGVQTNEIGRSRALRPGFLEIARRSGLPLALREIGTSAGLNLRWDHYESEGAAEVVERRGCDLNPIDVTTDRGRLDLLCFVWPDQIARFESLRDAIEVAARVPATLERADAADWVERQFAHPLPGACAVLFHSVVWLYLSDETQQRIRTTMQAAGERATDDAPVAWLSMESGSEDGSDQAEVSVTFWPGGRQRVVALAGYHGQDVVILPDTRSGQ